jgi:hypothetical protein
MKLFPGKVDAIAAEGARALLAAKAVEAARPKDVETAIAAELKRYLQEEREVYEEAKAVLERTGKAGGELHRVRRLVAEERGIGIGDETIDHLLDRTVEMLLEDDAIDEVFVEDGELRRLLAPIFRKHVNVDEALDAEIRTQLRHVSEGTPQWDIEYARIGDAIRRKRGLS